MTPPPLVRPVPVVEGRALDLSYYTPVTVAAKHRAPQAGKYEFVVNLELLERYVDNQFDANRCHLLFKVDGETLFDRELVREGDNKKLEFTFDCDWTAGDHELAFEIQPTTASVPNRLLRVRVEPVLVRGPLAEKDWVRPKNYARFFPREVPAAAAERHRYATELLGGFALRAFRRPPDGPTLDHLVALAEGTAAQPKSTFEAGIAQAMVAVLASPGFIFREEDAEPLQPGQVNPLLDEYTLASRLSYFFWSSMPDAELLSLAQEHRLRADLPAQVTRLLDDPRAEELVRNFTGQWLQARDIATVQINALDVYLRDHPDPEFEKVRAVFRRLQAAKPGAKPTPEEEAERQAAFQAFREFNSRPKPQLTDKLREAMRQETEMTFAYVLKEDRSVLELIESDYTFLNEDLAKHYRIDGVTGPEMRKVTLAPDSPRGGVLTQGTVLTVTSNPTRTSPVKRGVFILGAILGAPPPPPPPNIPALEDAASPAQLHEMSLRETLAMHAKNASCRACHNRMDPPGLALENFNAMGMWRESDVGRPIDAPGELITGEAFANVRELKHILATEHRRDFFYCLSEKLLTYALGRGVEYYDTETLDQLVAQLEAAGGKPSALLRGIVNSAPFQQRRPRDFVLPGEKANRVTQASPKS